MFKFELRTLLLGTAFMSVIFTFAEMFMSSMDDSPVGIPLAAVGGLIAAGFFMVLVGALILVRRPESDWAKRVANFGGITMACVFPAMIIALILSAIIRFNLAL